MPDMKANSTVNAVLWTTLLSAKLVAADPSAAKPAFDPPTVRSPAALAADAADGQAFLEWNPGLEDLRWPTAPGSGGTEWARPGTSRTGSAHVANVTVDTITPAATAEVKDGEPALTLAAG